MNYFKINHLMLKRVVERNALSRYGINKQFSCSFQYLRVQLFACSLKKKKKMDACSLINSQALITKFWDVATLKPLLSIFQFSISVGVT